MKNFFIAEVSSNHNSDLDRSKRFIEESAKAGFDAVKFQLFKIDHLFSPEILKKSKKHRDRKQWELPENFLPHLSECAKSNGIEFSCTPFYLEAVEILEEYVSFYKIASYELLWSDLLAKCSHTGKKVILSTGMATIEEISAAVKVLEDSKCSAIELLHCTSAYPTPPNEANLKAINTLSKCFSYPIGWSDHTVSFEVIERAVNKWDAQTIEMHVDLDDFIGHEAKVGHCWSFSNSKKLISKIREGILLDGSGIKAPVAAEEADRNWRADPYDGLRPLRKIRENY